jgi:S-formylglutathione hydrolase
MTLKNPGLNSNFSSNHNSNLRPELKLVKSWKSFDGHMEIYSHQSVSTQTPMRFALYRPPGAGAINTKSHSPGALLYWLSGLTCTEENFIQKAGAQKYLAENNLWLVAPDTSPRGIDIPGVADHYTFGLGAGYYLDATREPWAKNFQMYSYIVDELPQLLQRHFPIDPNRQAIFGHSMGGHGAITIGLKNPEKFKSISALAPISSTMNYEVGRSILKRYLGEDEKAWEKYDASFLIGQQEKSSASSHLPMLVDQGTEDEFLLTGNLQVDRLITACESVQYPAEIHLREGYDHSYYFVASFIEDHIKFHAKHLS